MPEPVWYRSLYWRIALGFVAMLAVLLVTQVFVFLWVSGRMPDFFPNRSPAQLAATLAADVAQVLNERPETDLSEYVNGRYSRSPRGFVVVLSDGRTIVSQRVPPPQNLARVARLRLPNRPPEPDVDRSPRRGGPPDRFGPG